MLALQHPYLANAIFAFTCTLGFVQVFMGLFMSGSLLALDASGSATTEGYTKFVPIAVAWESVAIATDMTVIRTGFRQTDWMVYNLILVAIECAFPVTLFTIGHITGVLRRGHDGTVRNMGGNGPQVRVDVTREEDYGMESMSNTGRDADLKPIASV
ncbi:hypothetical protein C8R41DRAFT_261759 [Lentinula lateritia]|uniref:Uncharacterized protein n=1 Tax=Lentinula lateritia TaxID=40482 RepID=A0ABQ8VJW1_9AGAR|nr:hypothetical protein C8R41DRAFT_261759 [Lentinula lateritia]